MLGSMGGDFEARPADGGENSFGLQFAVSAGHRVGIDGQVARQFANRGDHVARLECVAGNGEFHLPHDLFVNRQPVG